MSPASCQLSNSFADAHILGKKMPGTNNNSAEAFIDQHVDAIRAKEIKREENRAAQASRVGNYRWVVANTIHRLGNGKPLEFESRPFLKDIYRDNSLDLVIHGSAQWGKTIWAVVNALTCAALGMQVMFVFSKDEKRQKVVATYVDPPLRSVEMYKKLTEAASSRNATADSTKLKHFGNGLINFVSANTPKDFTTYSADIAMIDEHQECDMNNIKMVDDRLAGSDFAMKVRLGHPTTAGTDLNQNLDFLYQHSDRRVWKVPCDTCGKSQVLDWWRHVIDERRHKGGILSCEPRDREWRPGGKFDIRPVCEECSRPMDRLHSEGFWEAQSPEMKRRHGYSLSNLYNANVRIDEMLERYSTARYSARDMQEFVNKALGLPYDMDGSKINESMLVACGAGNGTGMSPYRFIPASHFDWKKELVA